MHLKKQLFTKILITYNTKINKYGIQQKVICVNPERPLDI